MTKQTVAYKWWLRKLIVWVNHTIWTIQIVFVSSMGIHFTCCAHLTFNRAVKLSVRVKVQSTTLRQLQRKSHVHYLQLNS